MKAYSGSTSEAFLPTIASATGDAVTAVAPAPEDPFTTFTDALDQQQASQSSPSFSTSPRASDDPAQAQNADGTASDDESTTTGSSNPSSPANTPALPTRKAASDSASDQDSGGTGTTSYSPYAWISRRPASAASGSSAVGTPGSSSTLPSDEPDFTGAAIVASVFGRGATPPNAAAAGQQPATSTTDTSVSTLPGTPLATIMAHAAILAASSKKDAANPAPTSAATAATDLKTSTGITTAAALLAGSLATAAKQAATPSGVEKKSAASPSERSFLQENAGSTPTTDTMTSLLQAALNAASNMAGNQMVTTSQTIQSAGAISHSGASISAAGTTNDKKMADMNSTLDLPSLVVSGGTNPLVNRVSADLHISLGSNHDFTDAINQVMHVADLNDMSRSTPPLRVAIEIQTPPGAIVNVYVSRQADSSYRAQLSTNDPEALSWVQDQIGSLKNTSDTGSAIRWSPAQLEPGTTSLSTSSGSANSDRGYEWDRGGQQDQPGRDQEERTPRRHALYDDSAEPDAAFEAFTAVGGIA